MLDSIVRKPNCTTDGKGAIPDMVSCDVEVDRNLDLSGIRLGLPSTAGWGTTGISNEVSCMILEGKHYLVPCKAMVMEAKGFCEFAKSSHDIQVGESIVTYKCSIFRLIKVEMSLHTITLAYRCWMPELDSEAQDEGFLLADQACILTHRPDRNPDFENAMQSQFII